MAILDRVAPCVRIVRHAIRGVQEERLLMQPLAAVRAGHAAQSEAVPADRRAEAEQPPFVGEVSLVVGLLVEADVELLDERGVVHVLLVLQLLLQLLIGLLDAGEGVVEADVHIDVLHQFAHLQEAPDAIVEHTLVDGAPKGQQVVGDGLQVGDVGLLALRGFLDQAERQLHVGEGLALDLLPQDDGVVVGRYQFGQEGGGVVAVVHVAQAEALRVGVGVAEVEPLMELLVILGLPVDHPIVVAT